ncbi:MAG: 30S ribosomal protein S17e [Candidatus Diapherotrites archaeon]|nr:30S ribosomal protein S17e [Candidatus Diapherotrites archaeon]
MGKQMSKVLKAKAIKLFSMFPDKFTTDFEKNKQILDEYKIFSYSKVDRNIVAGYITRIKTMTEKQSKVE